MSDLEAVRTELATESIPPLNPAEEVKPAEPEAAAGAPKSGQNKYEFNITMSCKGCSGAVERVLKKLSDGEGVTSYNVDLKEQSAVVYAEERLPYQTVLAKIQNTGKKVNEGFENGEKRSVEKVIEAAA